MDMMPRYFTSGKIRSKMESHDKVYQVISMTDKATLRIC